MKKNNMLICLLIISSFIMVFGDYNNSFAEDIITEDTVDEIRIEEINKSIVTEDTIDKISVEEINKNEISLNDKDDYSKIYNNLSKKLRLPEGYTDTEEEYNNLPVETKKILENMIKLEKIAEILIEKEINLKNQSQRVFRSAGSKSGFSRLTKGDILITSDNKSYHVIRHGHAAMLLSGTTIVEAVRSGVRRYNYDWLTRYKNSYAARVYGGRNKYENTNKTWAQFAADWAYGKRKTPYKITSDKDTTKTFYCSQLVYRSYLSASKRKIDLSEGATYIWPMGLYYNSNTYSVAMYKK